MEKFGMFKINDNMTNYQIIASILNVTIDDDSIPFMTNMSAAKLAKEWINQLYQVHFEKG